MPLQMPDNTAGASAQQPFEAAAAGGGLDIPRIGRRYRGDAVGELQAGLEKADGAVMLDAVDAPGLRRQSQPVEQVGRKLALVGEIVHGEHGRRTTVAAIGEIGHREPGLPVVAVHEYPARSPRRRPSADMRGDPSERAEAERVVGPVAAVGPSRTDCPAGRRDAAHPARTDRGRRPGRRARAPCRRTGRRPRGLRSPPRRPPSPRDSRAPA